MNKVTECNATNESLNPEIELGVLEIHMVGCTEPNNKRPRHNNHVHVDRRMTTDLPRLNPQSNIDHRQMERGLRCSSGQCQSLSKRHCQPLPNKMIKPD